MWPICGGHQQRNEACTVCDRRETVHGRTRVAMNFLITGGTGFIGAALANSAVAAGHHVRVIDDLSAGGERGALDPRVSFTRGDVRDIPKLWSLLDGIDCGFHLAARVSVPESVLYPGEYNAVNAGGTVSLMAAVRDAGGKRVG